MALGELKNGIGPDAYAIYQQVLAAVVERDHPVGSLYISKNPTSPAELYGGTWERIEGKFIMGASDSYPAGSTGGEAKHTLTEDELPRIRDRLNGFAVYNANAVGTSGVITLSEEDGQSNVQLGDGTKYATLIMSLGDSQPHNNMPPYYSAYIWRRVA